MTRKVTPWFMPKIKPVRVGNYPSAPWYPEKKLYPRQQLTVWDGFRWTWEDGMRCINQNRFWRGLARKP